MNCNSYDQCVMNEKNNMAYPTDTQSLYADRIYDNQTAHRRCYESTPMKIEGFGCNFDTWRKIFMIIAIICIAYLIISMCMGNMGPKKVVSFPKEIRPFSTVESMDILSLSKSK